MFFSLIGGGVKVQYCIRLLSLGYQNIQEEKEAQAQHSPAKLNQVKSARIVLIFKAFSFSPDTSGLLEESLQAVSDDIWC